MADVLHMQGSGGIAFLVSTGIVYEIVAASCSSPQTAEINASSRSDTLMKWVYIGLIQSVVFVAIAAYLDKKNRVPIIFGGVVAGGLMLIQYKHALNCGLKSDLPGTEQSQTRYR